MSQLRDQLAAAAACLVEVADRPRFEAEMIWCQVLGLSRAGLIASDDTVLSAERIEQAHRLIERRRQGEPMAYLLGRREFWSLDLSVTADTLIPRPETEGLVEWALSGIPVDESWQIADLGTGSGAIALAIATERPGARVTATDFSAAALAVARRNAGSLALDNVDFRLSDWFSALVPDTIYDLIVSNPPYVADGNPHLRDLRFEPVTALVSGADGLDAIRCLVRGAQKHLRPGGWLLLEHGADQAPAVRHLLESSGYAGIETRCDLAGHERLTGGHRP